MKTPRFTMLASVAVVMLAVCPATSGQTPQIQTSQANYTVGEPITVTFKNGPANAKDWVGIYPQGVKPGSVGSTLWAYVNGTQTATTGLANGSVTFAKGLSSPGTYDVHLLRDDGYDILATATFTVSKAATAPAKTPSVTTQYAVYLPGEPIVATFQNGPGNAKDWIGIYPDGVEPGSVGSTLWNYVNGTHTATTGQNEGTVTFGTGLNLAGDWVAFLLENDGYTKLAQTTFQVVDPTTTLVRPSKRTYAPGDSIVVEFKNGPGGAKDWIGIYPRGVVPGSTASTLWFYVNGTQTASTGLADGTVTFAKGLTSVGEYEVHLLLNDGYNIAATGSFNVSVPTASPPRVLSLQPAKDATGASPSVEFLASITNGTTRVVASTVRLKLDGASVAHSYAETNGLVTIRYATADLFAPLSKHTFELAFSDNASPAASFTNAVSFTVADYKNIVLPAPLYFENFDGTPEGALPAGWTTQSFTEVLNEELDLGNLDSKSYATWTTVSASRFEGSFITYSNPNAPVGEKEDYHRVLSANPANVVNGKVLNEPLARGRFVFGDSGYRQGRSQVLYLFTPDFDLIGKADVFVSFHSLWEQNQDSIGAVEFSIDQGKTWLPIVYMLDGPDVLKDANGNVDAVATFTTEYGDVARYTDPVTGEDKGGTYGAFLGAAISPALAPFISARVNDNPVESKRVELFALPQAANQPKVRFRFAHAGTDSWYFGIDDFGIYSIASGSTALRLSAAPTNGNQIILSWNGGPGIKLQRTDALVPANWQDVSGSDGQKNLTVAASGARGFYRAVKSN